MEKTARQLIDNPNGFRSDIMSAVSRDMPVYERPDGSRVQVLGGSVLASEGVSKVDAIELATGATIRESDADFYPGLKQIA